MFTANKSYILNVRRERDEKENTTMTREQAIRFVQDHGFTATQQTATFNGEWVESGTSFDETFGVRASYDRADVRQWMGY